MEQELISAYFPPLCDLSWKRVRVIYYWGPTMCGKTRRCYEEHPGLYNCPFGLKNWDGYFSQKTILIDNFYGQYDIHLMRQLMDGYPLTLRCRLEYTKRKRWDTVLICALRPPEEMYPDEDAETRAGFLRRISLVVRMGEVDE